MTNFILLMLFFGLIYAVCKAMKVAKENPTLMAGAGHLAMKLFKR